MTFKLSLNITVYVQFINNQTMSIFIKNNDDFDVDSTEEFIR